MNGHVDGFGYLFWLDLMYSLRLAPNHAEACSILDWRPIRGSIPSRFVPRYIRRGFVEPF